VKPERPRALVPDAIPLGRALAGCEPLQRLQQRLAEASGRMDAVRPLIPPGLRQAVRPGPVDEEGWTLLVSSTSAAAKLRQLLPQLEQALALHGWSHSGRIRIRVGSSHGG
jgi:hypothetical protein